MKIVCAWCGKPIGEKEPLEDTSITHGICTECLAKNFPDIAEKVAKVEEEEGNPDEWKLRESIRDTIYGLRQGVSEEAIRKQLTRNPQAKYWYEPEEVEYILKRAKEFGIEAAVPEVKLSTRLAEINNRIRQLNAQLATAKMGRPSKATQTIRMRIQEELDRLFVESDELTKQFLAKSKPPVVEKGNPSRVHFDRASIDSAIAAASRLKSDTNLYVFATHLGYTIDRRPPPGMQSYVIVHPDGSTETIKQSVGGNPLPRVRRQGEWIYVKVGDTEMRGRPVPGGVDFEQVSPTYKQDELQKAVDTIEGMLRKEVTVAAPKTEAERLSFHDRIFKSGSIPPLERLGRGQTANNLLPMPPESGPPLPRMWGLKWPWK